MKTSILKAPRQPIVIEDVPAPVPAPGEAIVTLQCAALNHRDVWLQHGTYHVTRYPVVPGADGAGIVTAVGEGVDPGWLGREVVINPGLDWGDEEHRALPEFYPLGTPRDGTFAEQIAVPAVQLFAKPPHLDWAQAAALPLSGVTGWRALMARGDLHPGETVLVTGVGGGVALFVLQYAAAAGARVFVTSGSTDKLERARAMGAAGGVCYRDPDWWKTLQAQAGSFDVIVDSAGGRDFGQLVELAAPGGRLCVLGATVDSVVTLDLRSLWRKQVSLLGTKMGSPRDFANMLLFVERHRLVPVVDRVLPFPDIATAYGIVDRGEQFGKVVLRMRGD